MIKYILFLFSIVLISLPSYGQVPCQEFNLTLEDINPTCGVDSSQTIVSTNETINFEAGANPDNGSVSDLTFTWNFGGNNIQGQNIQEIFNTAGVINATLTVSDNNGCSDTINFSFEVSDDSLMVVDGNNFTLQELVEDVLVTGDCANVSNITSSLNAQAAGANFNSFGYFNKACSSFPFEEGLLIASEGMDGIVTGFPGQNLFVPGGGPGDPDLSALGGGGATLDATVIEFDFTPFVDEISFNYIYSSNEYSGSNECDSFDTFAFILSGPGINDTNNYDIDGNPNTPDVPIDLGGQNIALIPGTNIPVSAVNIHNDNCPSGTPGEFAAPQLFDIANSPNNYNAYPGQTKTLTASADVIPGQTYNIKLAISDFDDQFLNSGVFIEGSSFNIGEVDLGPDITLGSDEAVCEGDTITLDAGQGGTNTTYTWFQDLDEIPGEDGQFLDVTESGTYQVAVAFSLDCLQTDSITIEFFPEPEVPTGENIELCAGETVTLDGTPANLSDIVNPQYQWLQDGVEISGATSPTLVVDEAGLYEIEVDAEACTNITGDFTVDVLDYQVDIVQPTDNCVDTGETLEISADVTGLSSAQQNNISYQWSYNGNTETTETIQLGSTQDVTLTTTVNGCERTSTETIEIYTNPEVPSLGENVICPGDTSALDATPDNASNLDNTEYTWFLDGAEIVGENDAVLQIDEDGTYQVEVDNNGCVTSESIDVNLVDYTVDLGSDASVCTDVGATNSFEIVPSISGIPDSELDQVDYSWDNGETSETITVDSEGTYTLTTTYLGCTETDEINVTFIQSLAVDLGPDFKSCFTEQEVLTTGLANDDPNISFTWFRDDAQLSNETSSSLAVEEEGTYEVEVNNQGCISSSTITITGYNVDNCTITQGLSPNGDEDNECLDLTFLNDRTGIDNVQIFNRYGRKVFESNSYVKEFCGQDDDGDRLTTGTYFYVIKLSSEDDQFGRVAKGYIYVSQEQ